MISLGDAIYRLIESIAADTGLHEEDVLRLGLDSVHEDDLEKTVVHTQHGDIVVVYDPYLQSGEFLPSCGGSTR